MADSPFFVWNRADRERPQAETDWTRAAIERRRSAGEPHLSSPREEALGDRSSSRVELPDD